MSLVTKVKRLIGLEKKRRSHGKKKAKRKKRTPPRKGNGEFRWRKKR
jgi:hypothetical protein